MLVTIQNSINKRAVVMRIIGSGVAVVSLLAMTNQVTAEQESGAYSSVLEEITVTATRREKGIQDVPISISAFQGRYIESMGITNSRSLESLTPGLQVQGGFSNSSPQWNIRGIGSNGFDISDVGGVGVYVDDVYLNSNVGQGFSFYDTERVEVLRGPQGTLFGANTTGGAIQFVSKRPSGEFGANGSLTIGKFGQRKIEGAFEFPVSDKLAVRAAYFSDENDGVAYNAFLQEDAAKTDTSAWRVTAVYEPAENLEVVFRAWHSNDTGNELVTYNQGTFVPGTAGSPGNFVAGTLCSQAAQAAFQCVDGFGYSQQAAYSGYHTYEGDQRDTSDISSDAAVLRVVWDVADVTITSVSAYKSGSRFLLTNIDASREAFFTEEYDSDVDQYTQEFRVASAGDGDFDWVGGVFYLFEEGHDSYVFTFPPDGIWREYDLERTNLSIFAEGDYHITDKLSLTGGLRYSTDEIDAIDYFSNSYTYPDGFVPNVRTTEEFMRANQTGVSISNFTQGSDSTAVTGRAIIRYQFAEDMSTYSSFSRGYRAGSFNGVAFSSSALTFVDPEYVDAFEVGVKSEFWDGRARLNVSAFHNDYTDLQVTTLVSLDFQLTNAGSATSQGMDIELELQPTDRLFSRFGLSFLDAEYEEFISTVGDLAGAELENAPSVTFNGLVRYEIPVAGGNLITLQTDFSYKGEHYQDFSNHRASIQDGYWLANASINFGPEDARYGIKAWVKNLTDEEYRVNWFNVETSGFNGLNLGDPLTAGVTFSFAID